MAGPSKWRPSFEIRLHGQRDLEYAKQTRNTTTMLDKVCPKEASSPFNIEDVQVGLLRAAHATGGCKQNDAAVRMYLAERAGEANEMEESVEIS